MDFLLFQATQYIHSENLNASKLLLQQLIKKAPGHSEGLRLLGVIAAKQGNNNLALEMIEKSLKANKKNGVAFSNKGNVLLNLGHTQMAIEAFENSIELLPNYSEAHSNLGNAYQVLHDYQRAIRCYEDALAIDPVNSDFWVNLGNAFSRINLYAEALSAYSEATKFNPNNSSAHFYSSLAHFNLGDFRSGWEKYEWRWLSKEIDSASINSKNPAWQGESFNGVLLVWSEQGIGDQILHGSILSELEIFPQEKLIALDRKLLPIFRRSYPNFKFIDRSEVSSDDMFDRHIPIGSLGKLFRNDISSFGRSKNNFLISDRNLLSRLTMPAICGEKKICGLSWKSSNKAIGGKKSMPLTALSQILKFSNLEFINLQYGDVSQELIEAEKESGAAIKNLDSIDLYEDVDLAFSLINVCDIIITTSNSIAHMAGALGKEVYLLLPFSSGRIWYWYDINGVSLWYPSIRIFKQEVEGDWSRPIRELSNFLEDRLAD